MLPKWVDNVVAKMHRYSIKQSEIAEKYGCTRDYINAILNGRAEMPKGAKEKILTAIDEIIAERE